MLSSLTPMNIGTIILDVGTLFLINGLLMATAMQRQRGRTDDNLFFGMMVIEIFIAISDMMTYLADQKDFEGARWCNLGGITVFYIGFCLISMVWLQYTKVRFKNSGTGEATILEISKVHIPGVILQLFLIVNLFTGWIFSVDENNVYHRGVLFIPMYIVLTFYLANGYVMVHKYRTVGKGEKLIPIWIYFMPLVLGILITFIIGGVSLAPAAIAISLAFTHLGTMNEIEVPEPEEEA